MRPLVVDLLLAILVVSAATACPDLGGPSSFRSCPETSAGERPLHVPKEAVDEAVFDNCFLATTPVVAGVETSPGHIERVLKPVEDVKDQEWVLAKDPRTGEVGWKRVKQTFQNWTHEVYSVRVGSPDSLPPAKQTGRTERHDVGAAESRDGGEGGEDGEPPPGSHVVRCTAGHPWAVRDADGVVRFRYTAALRVGDRLDQELGAPAQVVLAVEVRQEVARTYNFEVEDWNTYYVAGPDGQPGVLVHNTSTDPAHLRFLALNSQLPSRSGIYFIEAGGQRYIGSTVDLATRFNSKHPAYSLLTRSDVKVSFRSVPLPTRGKFANLTSQLHILRLAEHDEMVRRGFFARGGGWAAGVLNTDRAIDPGDPKWKQRRAAFNRSKVFRPGLRIRGLRFR